MTEEARNLIDSMGSDVEEFVDIALPRFESLEDATLQLHSFLTGWLFAHDVSSQTYLSLMSRVESLAEHIWSNREELLESL